MEEEKERNLKEKSRMLEEERIKRATEEIQAILEKYGVRLDAVARIPAAEIKIVLNR